MSDERKGLRALPPALLLAFSIGIGMAAARIVYTMSTAEPWRSTRFNLASEGVSFAWELLAVLGAFELARRLTGRKALGARIAAVGLSLVFVIGVLYGGLGFLNEPWNHKWIYEVGEYMQFSAWLLVPVGLLVACWQTKRELAIAVLVISLLTWPPLFLREAMHGWLPDGKTRWMIDVLFRMIRLSLFLAAFAAIARGTTTNDRSVAARGLRAASTALWLRVIATVSVVLVTLVLVVGTGGRGNFEVLRLVIVASAIVYIVALAQFGVGAARAARGDGAHLSPWPTLLGATASLWGCGVSLAQLPALYRMYYGGTGGHDATEQLILALPLVVAAGVVLVGIAISDFAAKRGDNDLRFFAQAKMVGFVALTLVALAIQHWMMPKALRGDSAGIYVILSLLAAGSAIAGTAMMAKLCGRGAAALEGEPSLPTASVISGGT